MTIGGEDGGASAELVASHARLRVLADVSKAFATVANDMASLVEKIARTTADRVGDGCIVTLVEGEHLVNAASAHRDPSLERDYRAYLAGMGISTTTSATVSAEVVRTGAPRIVPEIEPETVVAGTDEALRPLVRRLNVHSFVVVPIRAPSGILGTLSLVRSGPGRSYGPDDLTLLEDVADRAGLALVSARLTEGLERRVAERTAELEAVNRELQAFTYSVAHDLRAPLRSIDGFSKSLLEDQADRLDETGKTDLVRVRQAAQRMGKLIDALLDLAKLTRAEVRRERVDLSALARSVLGRLRDAHPDRAVELVVADRLVAEADPRLVEIVLTNLLGNAWKFTSKRPAARIEVAARADDGPQVYLVRDDGAGFDPAQTSRLFGVFQRLHGADDFEGTGIGLATVQRIVERHGGRIWGEGAVDRGATFYFTLEARVS